MRTKTIAVLVTIAFSVIGVLGDYFLKLDSAREQPLRDGLVLPRLRSLRLDRVRLGIRNETPEAGHHQRSLLCLPGAAPHRHRRGSVPGVTELL